jgi:hypothetical protein
VELTLIPATTPSDLPLPSSTQEIVNLVAAYVKAAGLEELSGLVLSATEPASSDRGKAWLRLSASGSILGLYAWTGSLWEKTPDIIAKGPTENRPINPPEGMLFFDETIHVQIIFERAKWRTVSGSPGDLKFVEAETLDAALTANPGWSQSGPALGRVLAAAGTGDGLTAHEYGEAAGAETITLTEDQLPAHKHEYQLPKGSNADNGDPGSYITTAAVEPNTSLDAARETKATGKGTAVSVMQPTLYRWCLVKE